MNMTNEEIGGEWDTGNYQILPEGYFKAVVKSAEAKVSNNGNDMVTCILNVEDDTFDGVTIYHHLVFKPEADNFNTKKRRWFQASAGLPFQLNDSKDSIAKLIVNRKLTIKVKTGKNRDGKEQNEIVGVHPYNWTDPNKNQQTPDVDDDLGDTFL